MGQTYLAEPDAHSEEARTQGLRMQSANAACKTCRARPQRASPCAPTSTGSASRLVSPACVRQARPTGAGHPRTGGLLSDGPDIPEAFRRAAGYVAKILDGAKPADLPVEQPTKLHLAINLGVARSPGIVIPAVFGCAPTN